MRPNENKISDGYPERALIEVEEFWSWENVAAQRVAVRCIAWLGLYAQQFGDLVLSPAEAWCRNGWRGTIRVSEQLGGRCSNVFLWWQAKQAFE